MKRVLVALILGFSAVGRSADLHDGAKVRAAEACVFQIVLKSLNRVAPADLELPRVRLSNEVSLEDFQNAVLPVWGFKPDTITNVFTPASNEIFLMADRSDYRNGRTIFDSLAHELTHFAQVRVMGLPIELFGDSEEMQAIDVQTRFRLEHASRVNGDDFVCP